ncbi:MAG TPA: hypothetical protein VHG27_07655 [Xanthobacteraceae bacterium]|nr:hypothetical protein [Xanthobacteraceae bacterium]
MNKIIRQSLFALGCAAAVSLGLAAPSSAAPVTTSSAAIQQAAPAPIIDVRSDRRWRRSYRRSHRWAGPRYYGWRGAYGYGPRYSYRGRGGWPAQECLFDEGAGRFRPCSMGPW